MYKLIKPLPKQFKIRVNPEQSEAVQKALFEDGYKWYGDYEQIQDLYKEFLYFWKDSEEYQPSITSSDDPEYFKERELLQIQFSDYFIKTNQMNKEQIIQEIEQTIDILQCLIKQAKIEEESMYFDLSKLGHTVTVFGYKQSKEAGFVDNNFLAIRNGYEFLNKGFYLDEQCNWEILTDSNGDKVLLPTKKTT